MTNNLDYQIIILGGGQSAAHAATTIRQYDSESSIAIVTNENYLPYERPPLSKKFLLNEVEIDEFLFFNEEHYQNLKIDILKNEEIKNVNFEKNIIESNNNKISYNKLLIATGCKNRTLNLENVDQKDLFYLRDINESTKIKNKFNSSENILIIGGGFIGLEIASSAKQLGKNVNVVELADNLMGRIVPKEISTIVRKKHEENGVNIHLRTNITSIKKNTDNYTIQLSNNASVICNMIIVGIGAIPNVEIFDNTALKIDNGIITNQYNKTSIENVFAAGDVSNFYHPLYEENIRLESWKHAQNHGVSAGKNIVGQKTEYSEVPWMWSDQYNLNLQLTGRCDEYDSLVKRGKDENDGIIYFFMKNNQVFGACGVGIGGKIAKDIRIAGILSDKKIKVAESDLSDSSIKLNKLLKNI